MNSIEELAAACGGLFYGENALFEGITTDSRQILPNNVFVALRGERFDGHDFAIQAYHQGAKAIVVDHFMPEVTLSQIVVEDTTLALGKIGAAYRHLFQGTVIGITGSSGKTTVKGMLAKILSSQKETLANQGNFNNQIGVPLTLMRMANQSFAVVEMGTSRPGEIAYLTSLVKPDIALLNNVMPAHIGGFGSLEAISEEKKQIFHLLKPNQIAVINWDDAFSSQWLEYTQNVRRVTYSMAPHDQVNADLNAEQLHAEVSGCYRFLLCHEHESVDVALAVLGKHMVANALAAAACALAAGCTLQEISMGLAKYRGERGRMQSLVGIQNSTLIDDTYNANLGSVKAAIDYLSTCGGLRCLALGELGELGETAQDVHKQIGTYAKKMGIEALYTVGETAALAAEEFGEGGMSFSQKTELLAYLQKQLDENTTVLFKGSRSSRMEEICRQLLFVEESA